MIAQVMGFTGCLVVTIGFVTTALWMFREDFWPDRFGEQDE